MTKSAEIPSDGLANFHPRLEVRSLLNVRLENIPDVADVGYRFHDGTELLGLIKIKTRREKPDFRFEDERLESQFLLLDKLQELSLSEEELKIVRQNVLPISELDRDLSRHHIKQSRSFESRVKTNDIEFKNAAGVIDEYGASYGIEEQVKGLKSVVDNAANTQKDFRTASLRNDFGRSLGLLHPSIDIWLKLPSYSGRVMKAARLAGFAIHGESGSRAVEPIIEGFGGTKGFVPEALYIDPSVQLRVGEGFTKVEKA